jgi:enolase
MAGYTGKVKIGMDVAALEFLTKDGLYDLDFKEQPEHLGSFIRNLCLRSPMTE